MKIYANRDKGWFHGLGDLVCFAWLGQGMKQAGIEPSFFATGEQAEVLKLFGMPVTEDATGAVFTNSGYETAVKALVEAKVNNMPVPIDQAPQQRPSNVVNLMDALRKSIGADKVSAKKPPKSVKEAPAKGIGIVKTPAKSAKRKSA